ncbi:unnamed protein product [Caenorhabditis bovis]|uniref:Uncharacterized protein n=1 Tax=Caenorhabditis bovis TaxID=2654633 RepID=A0A8S1EZF4_9PELO|nr:unnamed protein product [Caenorhabditis bovis]
MLKTTPSTSQRRSPIVTRSVSRLGEYSFRLGQGDQSTPKSRPSIPPEERAVRTVERHHEIADDDYLNDSQFVYREHFTLKERTEMGFVGL